MKNKTGLSRRQFCVAGGAAAVLVATGALGHTAIEDAHAVYLRPPGAESETCLLSKCDRCERCVQACPYNLIQPRPLSLDFATVGTPEVIFKSGYCDFCMKCIEACPTGALSAASSSANDIGVAKVISDACVAWDWGGCTICADVCPVDGAITLDERGRPHVDEILCDGCGLCQSDCPAPSLRAYDSSIAEKGIYVVSRDSAAAKMPDAITSEQFESYGNVRAEEAAQHIGANGARISDSLRSEATLTVQEVHRDE